MWMKQRNQWPLLASTLNVLTNTVLGWNRNLERIWQIGTFPDTMQIHGNYPTLGGERNNIGGLSRHTKALCNCWELWTSKVLPSLHADRLGCHSFRDAGRRVETPDPEAEGSLLIMAIAVARESAFCTNPQAPVPTHRVSWRGQMTPANTVAVLQKNSEIREPAFCIMCSQHAWPLRESVR